MRQEIPVWVAVIVIIVVIVVIGTTFFLSSHRRNASPEEIEQKMQLYKSYRMKGMMKSSPSQSNP